jgi:S1-C subfamily serine protease
MVMAFPFRCRASSAQIAEVAPVSPRELAGLKSGDIVIEFDGEPATDSRHLQMMVAEKAPGSQV